MAAAPECPEKVLAASQSAYRTCVTSAQPEAVQWPAPPPPYSSATPIGFTPTGLNGQSSPPSYAYATESTTFVQQPAQHTIVREVLLVESPRHQHRRRSPLGLLAKIVNQGQGDRHPRECQCQHQEDCIHHASNGHLGHSKHHRGHRGHRGHHHH